LRVSVDYKHPPTHLGQGMSQIDDRGGLGYAAFLERHGNNSAKARRWG
jgi:hypothetical protein